jgi:uncharacterized protein YcaQ
VHLEAGADRDEVMPALDAELALMAAWIGLDEIVHPGARA